jgi:hypothetical protein
VTGPTRIDTVSIPSCQGQAKSVKNNFTMTPPAAFTSTKIKDNDRYNNFNSRTITNKQNNRSGAKLYLLGFPVFIGSFLG